MTTTAPAVQGHAGRRAAATLPTLVTVTALVTIVTSLGAPVIPSIAKADGVSLGTGEWVLTAALMVGAAATPALGRLADGSRQRRVVQGALLITFAGCVLSALSASNFGVMVTGRCLQGCGFGLMPVTMAIARRQLDPPQVARAIGTLSVTAAVGAGLGYPLTGFIADRFDFHIAYAVGAGMMAAGVVLVAVVLPAVTEGRRAPFDLIGWVLLAGAIVALSVALSEGGPWGWTSPGVVALLAAAVGLGVTWTLHQLRVSVPLIELRQVRHRAVMTADIAGFLGCGAMYLYLPIMVEFVQAPSHIGYGFGSSILVSGCLYLPLSVMSFIASRGMGLYERLFGARTMVPFGLVVFGAASAFFGLVHGSLWEAFLSTAVCGVGLGFSFAAMPGYIVRAVPPSQTGAATALYTVARAVGLSVGSAVASAILSSYTGAGDVYPRVQGFELALIVGGIVLAATGVFAYVAPGKVERPVATSRPLVAVTPRPGSAVPVTAPAD